MPHREKGKNGGKGRKLPYDTFLEDMYCYVNDGLRQFPIAILFHYSLFLLSEIIFCFFQGNRLFKEGKYELAKAKYEHVFSFILTSLLFNISRAETLLDLFSVLLAFP